MCLDKDVGEIILFCYVVGKRRAFVREMVEMRLEGRLSVECVCCVFVGPLGR